MTTKAMQPVLEPEPVALAPVSATQEFMATFERLATNPAVDVAKLSALLDMRDRILAKEAEDAFARAFAALQGDLPTVIERGKGDSGKWFFAPLEDIMDAIRPILVKHGFALSHKTEWTATTQAVIGILTHRDGHSRESRFESEPDKTGSKNSIQALGSVTTYGRRYTACELLGIVSRREDNDGRSAQAVKADKPEGFDEWLSDLESAAMQGMKVLSAAWQAQSPKGCKVFLTSQMNTRWDSIKATANEVDRA